MAPPRSKADQIKDLVNHRGSVKEARERLKADQDRRARASTLLSPADVRGEYDAERVLKTTLGGELRTITVEDLQAFRDNIATIGRHYKKGLTAQKVINLARPEDRERANQQIHHAIPAGANRGTVRFITNAGPNSDVVRHHVHVDLMGYSVATASPLDPKKLATELVKKSPLRLWCDCGRWRFWYGYIATIGGFNLVYNETAFPKIKNPMLTGVACKHILRVMHELQRSTSIRNVVAQMIERGQSDEARKHATISKEQAEKIAKQQARKRSEIQVKHPQKEVKALQKIVAAKKAPPKKDADQARFDAERNLRRLKELGQISDADFKTIMTTLRKK